MIVEIVGLKALGNRRSATQSARSTPKDIEALSRDVIARVL
jgi:hypothetical protein